MLAGGALVVFTRGSQGSFDEEVRKGVTGSGSYLVVGVMISVAGAVVTLAGVLGWY